MRRFAAALLLLPVACASAAGGPAKGDLLVFAAASLTESFTSIGAAFEAAHPGVHVHFNFGPSDGLANGISESGRADLFASASAQPMDTVARSPGVTDRAIFARNRLVVIVPRDDPAHIMTLADVARPGLKLALAAPGVPAGAYARKMLTNAGLQRALKGIHSNEVDVKGVVQKVVLGEADAGIVYATDVTSKVTPSVRTIPIPDAVNVTASYPIAVVAGSKQSQLAREFVDYVLGPGRTFLRAAGFLPPT